LSKAEASVEDLVRKIERGELALPEMQRQYVWRSSRVRDLFDSLYRGYPSGTILLWETDEAVPTRDFAVGQQPSAFRSRQLLLDGQQRLTSLSALIRGEPVTVRGRQRPIDLLFNLDHPEQLTIVTEVDEAEDEESAIEEVAGDAEQLDDENADSTEDELQSRFDRMTFVVATKKLARRANWIRVSEVFKNEEDAPFLAQAGVDRISDPRYTMYSQRLARLRRIRLYMYRMDVLEPTLSYEEVTEIFVRVNSLGAKLRSSDLALAQITAKWRNSLELFQQFQAKCASAGFDLDLGIHLKAMVAFGTGQSRFATVGGLSLERLQSAWDESCQGMQFAINFLKNNAGVDSPAVLSSPFILITIAYFGHKQGYVLDGPTSDRLRKWVLLANAKGRYSRGSSETLLDQDLTTVRESGEVSDLLDRLRNQVGRLDIVPAELAGRNQRSALFKTMFLAFRAAGAQDWNSNLLIALDHTGAQHKLQFHHIFPKAFLRRIGRSAREADDIANLAFIGGRTNRRILDKPPDEYLKPLMSEGSESSFAAQCIPTDDELLTATSYNRFLSVRRDLIAERLNLFLETSGLEHGRERADPRLRELDEQISAVELQLRRMVDHGLGGDRSLLPDHVSKKIAERLAAKQRSNPGLPAASAGLLESLEYCDFRELQDVITSRALWERFAPRFASKESLAVRFAQLAELRNSIRHGRSVDDVTRKDGEVALLWFRGVLVVRRGFDL
jgi:hypothetical protein